MSSKSSSPKSFDSLWLELQEISTKKPSGSNTAHLLDMGVHAICKKVLEEAGEIWLAAEYQSDEDLATEISQLLYHLQVLMLARGLSLEDVYRKL